MTVDFKFHYSSSNKLCLSLSISSSVLLHHNHLVLIKRSQRERRRESCYVLICTRSVRRIARKFTGCDMEKSDQSLPLQRRQPETKFMAESHVLDMSLLITRHLVLDKLRLVKFLRAWRFMQFHR